MILKPSTATDTNTVTTVYGGDISRTIPARALVLQILGIIVSTLHISLCQAFLIEGFAKGFTSSQMADKLRRLICFQKGF